MLHLRVPEVWFERNPFTVFYSNNRLVQEVLVSIAISFDILFVLQGEMVSKDFTFVKAN
jgi:hypothetical protein